MMRLIDADALIKRWNEMTIRGRTEFDQEIMLAPTIDAVSEWIPCSERMPSKGGTYLVTYEWVGKSGTKYIEIEGIDFERGKWDCHDYETVTAWMPLPKPYGEREGE